MLAFDCPWVFAAAPLPLAVWWLAPPYRAVTSAVRIPFFAETAEAARLAPKSGALAPTRRGLVVLLAVVVWGTVLAAAARPQWVEPPLQHEESARDLMLAIDLSQSMEARDFVDPSGTRTDRLTAVQAVVDDFVTRRPHDRLGLIVFGQAAFPQAPLTLDHDSVRLLLAEIRIGMAGPQTALGDAIGVAIKMTAASKAPEKVLVLLTDGNDTASKLPAEQAAAIAKASHLVIHTIGIGDPTASGEEKVDLAALERIAAATGGRTFRAENRDQLATIYATLDQLTPAKTTRTLYRPKRELYWVPLGAAGVVLAVFHLTALLRLRSRRA